jgi:selenocysteine lyase/cysteine desulfurase
MLSEPETNDQIERAREKMARLMGAQACEIGWVPNTAIAAMIVANGIDWREGDNVVTVRSGFPSSVYPWLGLRRQGVKIRFVEAAGGRVPVESIAEAMDSRTRALNISWVEFSTGFRHDLSRLGQIAHERNIIFNVDAMQGLGALQLDVEETGVHFLGAGAPKWLMGPHGLGVFYARKEMLDRISHVTANWRSVPDSSDYLNYEQPWVDSASRVEGSTPNMSAIVAFDAVLDMIHEVGPPRIEARILQLTDRLIDGLLSREYDLVSPLEPNERSGIVCFRAKGDPMVVLARAEAENVIIAVRLGVVRVSPHFYNNEEEIDRLLALL